MVILYQRLERDLAEGKITEEYFAERQSDILTAFTDTYGDPLPPSNETTEQKEERKARKLRKKAVDEKEKMNLIVENGFKEGYTIAFNATIPRLESNRIKALDDPTKEVYNKMYKPFKETLQYRYSKDFGVDLEMITVLEDAEDELLHTHSMLNVPFRLVNDEKTREFIAWMETTWKRYSGADIVRTVEGYKLAGKWCFAPYMAKEFFDRVPRKRGNTSFGLRTVYVIALSARKRKYPISK